MLSEAKIKPLTRRKLYNKVDHHTLKSEWVENDSKAREEILRSKGPEALTPCEPSEQKSNVLASKTPKTTSLNLEQGN